MGLFEEGALMISFGLTSNDLGESRRVDTLPSGKRLHNYEKSSVLIGKSAINGTCSIAFCMFTRG